CVSDQEHKITYRISLLANRQRPLPSSGFLNQPLHLGFQRAAQRAAAPEVGLGFYHLALHQPSDAATPASIGHSRIELQGLIEICNRPREFLFREPSFATMAPGFG